MPKLDENLRTSAAASPLITPWIHLLERAHPPTFRGQSNEIDEMSCNLCFIGALLLLRFGPAAGLFVVLLIFLQLHRQPELVQPPQPKYPPHHY